jgi:hypothetical protein
VCTFKESSQKVLTQLGFITIGKVVEAISIEKPAVRMQSKVVPRRGWIHFRSEAN